MNIELQVERFYSVALVDDPVNDTTYADSFLTQNDGKATRGQQQGGRLHRQPNQHRFYKLIFKYKCEFCFCCIYDTYDIIFKNAFTKPTFLADRYSMPLAIW